MTCAGMWARRQNTPIPRSHIITSMEKKGIKDYTAMHAINMLVRWGYLRRSRMIGVNQTFYVMLRNIS
jgi:hypothetical protein